MTAPQPYLYVATPCYGGMAHAAYVRGLLALKAAFTARQISLRIDLGGGDALISRARARLMARFLASPATHLLFIDADIGFEVDQVFALLAADKPVIGGAYIHKPPEISREAKPALEVEFFPDGETANPDGLCEVASIGAGFLLISRPAAQQLDAAFGHLRARLGDVHGEDIAEAVMVFDPLIDPDTSRYLADHQAFCRRWRSLGGEVWADMDSRLIHVGEKGYAAGGG